MSSAVFRLLIAVMLIGAAGAAVYFHYFRPPLACADDRVVNTVRRIVKERLLENEPSDVELHLVTTVATARDGVRCAASAQILKGMGKDDEYRDIEFIAFVGKSYYTDPADKRGFTVFANFKK